MWLKYGPEGVKRRAFAYKEEHKLRHGSHKGLCVMEGREVSVAGPGDRTVLNSSRNAVARSQRLRLLAWGLELYRANSGKSTCAPDKGSGMITTML